MARLEKVASRYAKAIFDSQKEGAKAPLKDTIEELARFAVIIDGSKELQHVFNTAIFSETQTNQIVEDLSAKLKISIPAKQILLVLSGMKRLGSLTAIVDRVRRMMLESAQVIPLQVESVGALSSDQKEKIENRFTKILGKKVEAKYIADPTLIGGLRVTAEGRTFDGSMAGWLSAFEEQLSATVAL